MPKLKVQPAEIEVAEIQGVELKAAAVAAIDDTTIDVEGIDVVGAEIDLQPVGEETTQFSDSEEIPVEHINFEFEQSHKLQGMLRQLSVFNDSQCYQSIKNKHRRKYKFRLDLAYLDPRPFRLRNIVWKWLYASLALWVLASVFVFAGWFDQSSVTSLGIFTGIVVIALLTFLTFFYLSHDTVYFRSQFGKIRVFELANNNPDKDSFHDFVNRIVVQINKSKAAKNMNQSQLLAAELKELRRLKDENIVPKESYEKAKLQIFKHEAFKAAE
jgi:hypothetical protein